MRVKCLHFILKAILNVMIMTSSNYFLPEEIFLLISTSKR